MFPCLDRDVRQQKEALTFPAAAPKSAARCLLPAVAPCVPRRLLPPSKAASSLPHISEPVLTAPKAQIVFKHAANKQPRLPSAAGSRISWRGPW